MTLEDRFHTRTTNALTGAEADIFARNEAIRLDTERRAVRTLMRYAHDVSDAQLLLEALGLNPAVVRGGTS